MKKLLDYKYIVLNPDDDHWCLEVEDEIVVKLGDLKIEEQQDGTAVLHFNYEVISGQTSRPLLEFKEHLGDIIMTILDEKYK